MCSRGDLQSCGEEVEEEEGASFIHSCGGGPIFIHFVEKLLYKVRCLPCACRHSHCLFRLKYATLQQTDRCEGQLKMVCTYVCVCVCMGVSFERLILRQNCKEECCAIMYEKVCAMRRFERIDIRANGNVLSLGMH